MLIGKFHLLPHDDVFWHAPFHDTVDTIITTLLNFNVWSSKTLKGQCRLADTSCNIYGHHWDDSVHKNVYLISFQNFRRAISIS